MKLTTVSFTKLVLALNPHVTALVALMVDDSEVDVTYVVQEDATRLGIKIALTSETGAGDTAGKEQASAAEACSADAESGVWLPSSSTTSII